MTPEQLADTILRAAGSALRHYTPTNRAAIIDAAREAIAQIKEAAHG
ncbi:hypothetical protein [Pseudogemmobacter sonorensis]